MMRTLLLVFAISTVPCAALAATDIVRACYSDCEDATHSNPEYKACLARAADKADKLLNDGYKQLQDAIKAQAKDMSQPADTHLEDLRSSQKYWINFRDSDCQLEDNLAFGGTAMGGNYSSCLCSLSYERLNDFDRMRKQVMGQ
jgi:uncharacterized protein YecT (DUF1311 family)